MTTVADSKKPFGPKPLNQPQGPGEAFGRALVVDDDPNVLEVIEMALERIGFFVASVGSATEALAILDEAKPDVVISDWKMPGMNGIELVAKLKERDPQLTTVLMTGYGTKETVIEAFTRGRINYYLSKPFKLEELLEIVSAAVKAKRLRLSENEFRRRLEGEIRQATQELAEKNELLEIKNAETQHLNQELEKRRQEIENTQKYLENILESSVDAIISTDPAMNITFFSRGAEEMFGLNPAETVHEPLENLWRENPEDFKRLLDAIGQEDRVRNFETTLVSTSGKPLIVDISISRLGGEIDKSGILLIIKDVAERKRLEDELRDSNQILERLSITDGLTNLFNHRHFQQSLVEEFQRARRFNTNLSLIMLDLDDFKLVNDNFGHQVGDQVLIALADVIRECVREVDVPARYGGEEFAIILPQTDVGNAAVVAERLKETIQKSDKFKMAHPELNITASLGVSGIPDIGVRSPADLIRFADSALYRAKRIGKNRVVIGGSMGEQPLGKGERLTQAEKKYILRRLGDRLRGLLDLDAILQTLLQVMVSTLRQTDQDVPCTIMLAGPDLELLVAAASDRDAENNTEFKAAAQKAVESQTIQVISESDPGGPIAAYPIMVHRQDRGREVVGVMSIGATTTDQDFFIDIVNQAALSILNAKLYRELENSKKSLEKKVGQLMTLSLMGMAMQRGGLAGEDIHADNQRLLARSLTGAGFEKALVYIFDLSGETLHSGVRHSLVEDPPPAEIRLSRLDKGDRLRSYLLSGGGPKPPILLIRPTPQSSPSEREWIDRLGIGQAPVSVAKIMVKDAIWGVVFAAKSNFSEEDADLLNMFVLHAGLILENLQLARMYQVKTLRLTLLQQLGQSLSNAGTYATEELAARQALRELTRILNVAEVSIYALLPDRQNLELLACAPDTRFDQAGSHWQVGLQEAAVMNLVVKEAEATGRSTPMILDDVGKSLGRSLRKRFATCGYLGAPLFGGGRLIGVMNVSDKLDGSPFTPEDADLAQMTGGILAGVLHRRLIARDLEAKTMEIIKSLVQLIENDECPERSKNLAELAGEIAGAIGLNDRAIKYVQKAAWVSGPTIFKSTHGQRIIANMKDWLETVRRDVFHPARDAAYPSAFMDERAKYNDPSQIIRTAGLLLNGCASASRTSEVVAEVLLELSSQKAGLDPDILEALFRVVLKKGFKSGSMRLKLSNKDIHRLEKHFEAEMNKPNEPTANASLARRLLDVTRQMRETPEGEREVNH